MNIFLGVLLGLAGLFFIGWGLLCIVVRELPWSDNSEYSSGASGTLRGWFAAVVGGIIFLLGNVAYVAAFMVAGGR